MEGSKLLLHKTTTGVKRLDKQIVGQSVILHARKKPIIPLSYFSRNLSPAARTLLVNLVSYSFILYPDPFSTYQSSAGKTSCDGSERANTFKKFLTTTEQTAQNYECLTFSPCNYEVNKGIHKTVPGHSVPYPSSGVSFPLNTHNVPLLWGFTYSSMPDKLKLDNLI